MKLVSLTLTHDVGEKIREAIESVASHVDECIVIHTCPEHSIGSCSTMRIAEIACSAGGADFRSIEFTWENDFSKARNFALDEAARQKADWAVMIDSDQRIDWNGHFPKDGVHHHPAKNGVSPACWKMRYRGESFAKEQIFKIPSERRYSGVTHEAYPAADCPEWPSSRVWEAAKTPAEMAGKLQRDTTLLLKTLEQEPQNARAWYYLGQSHQSAGHWEAARAAYLKCRTHTAWDEEGGWAAYQGAVCALEDDDVEAALDIALGGMKTHAGMPELPWLAGYCEHKLGHYQQALRWARLATAHAETLAFEKRVGFSYPFACWEGPFNLMEHAYRALGDLTMAKWAADQASVRRAHRLGGAT